MNADIVHEHNVSPLEGWNKKLFDVGSKYFAGHRTFEHKGCGNTFGGSAAMKVIVFQFPCKTFCTSRSFRGAMLASCQ